jgi:hypothetical protein
MALMLGMHARIEEERSSFLKERSKKLLPSIHARLFDLPTCINEQKFFGSFFSKKNILSLRNLRKNPRKVAVVLR